MKKILFLLLVSLSIFSDNHYTDTIRFKGSYHVDNRIKVGVTEYGHVMGCIFEGKNALGADVQIFQKKSCPGKIKLDETIYNKNFDCQVVFPKDVKKNGSFIMYEGICEVK